MCFTALFALEHNVCGYRRNKGFTYRLAADVNRKFYILGVIRLKTSKLPICRSLRSRVSFAAVVILALLLPGCASGVQNTFPSQTGAAQSAAREDAGIPFAAQYIRTDGYVSGAKYPAVAVIRSKEELEEYYAVNKDVYDMSSRDKIYPDTTIGFADAMQDYSEAYFGGNALILVLLEEPSGSIRHNVSSVTAGGNGLCISIERLLPEVGTCDMAEWHIFAEIAKDKAEDNVTVTFSDINI